MMVNKEIHKVNSYLKEQLWMDFEVYKSSAGEVVLAGFIDELEENKVEIIFKEPYMIACTMCFSFEGGNQFISIVEGEKATEINLNYNVTVNNYIFELINTSINAPMYVIAKDIKVNVIKD